MNKKKLSNLLIKSILISVLLISLSYTIIAADLTYDSTQNNVSITYDELSRIKSKNTTSTNITYNYDAQLDGTLTNVTINNITIKYEYDDKRRIKREIRIMEIITSVIATLKMRELPLFQTIKSFL